MFFRKKRADSIDSLDKQVEKLLKDDPRIASLIEEDPSRKDILYGRMVEGYKRNKGIIKGAEIVDKVDRILGPIEAALAWFGPGPGYLASFGLRAIEEGLFKIPYAVYYTAKTGDYKALPGWALSEAAATVLPYGDIIDTLPIYKNRANRYMRKYVADDFVDYYGKKKEEPKQRRPEGKVIPFPRRKKMAEEEELAGVGRAA